MSSPSPASDSTESEFRHQDDNPDEKSPFPINKLPLELLAQILVLWSYSDDDAPWMAAAVCHHWRNVALTTNKLWGRIMLNLVPDEEIEPEWADEETLTQKASPRGKRRPYALWFQRAHDTDITLHITALSSFPRINIELYHIMSGMQSRVADLRRLTLSVESNLLADVALSILFDGCNDGYHLDYLEIEVSEKRVPKAYRIPSTTEDTVLDDFWDYAPPAKTLAFRGCLPRRSSPGIAAQTHTLILENVPLDPKRFIGEMSGFTSLRSLSLDGETYVGDSTTLPPQPMTLNHLTNLSIHRIDTTFCSSVFQHLTTPQLVSLSIRNGGLKELRTIWGNGGATESWFDCMAPFSMALEAFVRRSPVLRSLNLDRCPIDDKHLLNILQAAPELQTLRMVFLLVGYPTMRGLTPYPSRDNSTSEVICPRLQHLVLENCDSIEKDHLLELLRARCRKKPPFGCDVITDVTVFGCEKLIGLEAEVMARLGPARPHVTVVELVRDHLHRIYSSCSHCDHDSVEGRSQDSLLR